MKSRVVKATVIAWSTAPENFRPADLTGMDAAQVATRPTYYLGVDATPDQQQFYLDCGYRRVGFAEITLHIDDDEALVKTAIEVLEAQEKAILAKAGEACTKILHRKHKLLAIAMDEPAGIAPTVDEEIPF